MGVSPDQVLAILQLLPLPSIPEIHGPRDIKSSSQLATGWKKTFLQQQRFGKQHPGMAEPPPHAETLHTTNSPALGPAVSAVNSCNSQSGVPAPSNALSACENIHLEQQRGVNKLFEANSFTWLHKFIHKVLISPKEKRANSGSHTGPRHFFLLRLINCSFLFKSSASKIKIKPSYALSTTVKIGQLHGLHQEVHRISFIV